MVIEPADARAVVLFAAGGGGDPERHLPLLEALAARSCTVAAPRFPRLSSPSPSGAELRARVLGLQSSLNQLAGTRLPITGVGHSIGATALLIGAGAKARTLGGDVVQLSPTLNLKRLLLMAPATDFFRGPGALDQVGQPITVWTGSEDRITPPAQAEFLKTTLAGRAPIELRICENAGHFSFMNTPPPHASEPLPDREAFLAELAKELGSLVAG